MYEFWFIINRVCEGITVLTLLQIMLQRMFSMLTS